MRADGEVTNRCFNHNGAGEETARTSWLKRGTTSLSLYATCRHAEIQSSTTESIFPFHLGAA